MPKTSTMTREKVGNVNVELGRKFLERFLFSKDDEFLNTMSLYRDTVCSTVLVYRIHIPVCVCVCVLHTNTMN